MIYKIGQIKYNKDNEPSPGENVFQGFAEGASIVQLGIQAPPGTRFLINNVSDTIVSDIEIGVTGIFELDLKNANTAITQLSFTSIKKPVSEEGNILPWDILVDYLYES